MWGQSLDCTCARVPALLACAAPSLSRAVESNVPSHHPDSSLRERTHQFLEMLGCVLMEIKLRQGARTVLAVHETKLAAATSTPAAFHHAVHRFIPAKLHSLLSALTRTHLVRVQHGEITCRPLPYTSPRLPFSIPSQSAFNFTRKHCGKWLVFARGRMNCSFISRIWEAQIECRRGSF